MHVIAAKAVAFAEALLPEFKESSKQVSSTRCQGTCQELVGT